MYEKFLIKRESDRYGLTYIPSLNSNLDSMDYIDFELRKIAIKENDGNRQFTFRDRLVALRNFKKIRNNCKCIVEIGVASNFAGSSTEMWLTYKKDNTHFFGIDLDIERKQHHQEWKPNVHMLQMDSKKDKEKILDKLKESGCEQIDVLFIDGDHSVEMMLNDWGYSEYVRKGGLIVVHDLAVHPGPYLVWDAINKKEFEKSKHFCDVDNDWGVGILWKR